MTIRGPINVGLLLRGVGGREVIFCHGTDAKRLGYNRN